MTSFRNVAFLLLLLFSVGLIHAQAPTDITARLTFTTIDVPGAGFSSVNGINTAGDMVGYYGTETNAFKHGFLLHDGVFTYIDYPGADETLTSGINDSGLIVGSAEFQGGFVGTGFLYDGTAFTAIRKPGEPVTFFWAINNAGDVVGSAGTSGYYFSGFMLRNRHFKAINFSGQYDSDVPGGINNLGQIAGYTIDGIDRYAWLYRNARFKSLNFPGALFTQASGINDDGVIVGWYFTYPNLNGFAFKNGKYVSFSYPGALYTSGWGINASGQIVGQYELPDYTYHGFVTSPITAADFQ